MNAVANMPLISGLTPLAARLVGFSASEQPLIVLDADPSAAPQPARSLCELASADIGSELLLVHTDGHRSHPVILGKMLPHPRRDAPADDQLDIQVDGKQITLEARERLELKCGKAHLSMEADGRIKIQGGYILSHASGINRIRGAAIKAN